MQTKVSCSELKIGMFVSALDREWTDTPFLFQGFLIENEEDIQLLQQYCEFVHIDWGRSPLQQPNHVINRQAFSVTENAINKKALGGTSQDVNAAEGTSPRGKENYDTSRISEVSEPFSLTPAPQIKARISPQKAESTDNKLDSPKVPDYSSQDGLFSGFAGKMIGLFKGRSKEPQRQSNVTQQGPALEEPAVTNERPVFIPSDIELSTYVDAKPVEEEIAPAISAHNNANNLLDNLVLDIKSNKQFSIEDTEIVIDEVVSSMIRNPDAMMWVTRLRKQDEQAYGHGLQVAVYLVALGRHLGLPRYFLDRLCMIGLLLDIGNIKLPRELLLKKGRLTSEEFETIKSHVQLALEILKDTRDLHPDVLQGIAQHHERENGTGYPAGLSGNQISLFGRMSAIVDSFSALTSPRSYADTMPAYEALQCLINFNPGLYQASMVEQFVQAIGIFPVGSMVELSSGEVAVVISHSKVRRLKPRVLVISDSSKRPSPQPTTLDLLYQRQIANQGEIYIQRGLPTGAFGLDAREFYLT
jgi:HD-GYP domain-containing protein (c-di-GMP phosphodiesterase class II)